MANDIVSAPSDATAQNLSTEHLNQYEEVYLRGHDFMKKFDADLVNAVAHGQKFDLAQNDHYRKLLAVWDIRARVNNKLAYIYYRAVKDSKKDGKASVAAKVADFFAHRFEKESFTKKYIFNDLAANLKRVDLFFASHPNSSDFNRVESGDVAWIFEKTAKQKDDDNKTVSNFNLLGTHLVGDQANVDSSLDEMSKKIAATKTDLSEEIEDQAAQIEEEANERIPQSVIKFAPGVGRSGSLVGTEFPANTWAITFDDGPHATRTLAVLKTLKEYNVPGAFFEMANAVRALPSISKQVIAEHHVIANHTIDHPQLTKLSRAGIEKQIITTSDVIEKTVGVRPTFMRCPYGAGLNNPTIRDVIAKENMIHVFWNVDTLDWQDKNPTSILNRAMKQMIANKKGIVLFHDIHAQSVQAIALLLKKTSELTKSGAGTYNWKSLPEIVETLNSRE